jgi:hypothetical protein
MPLSAKQMEYLALAVCYPPIHSLAQPGARLLKHSKHTNRYNKSGKPEANPTLFFVHSGNVSTQSQR